ncbi:LysR family transcriptional regulator [Streptomyces sp. 4F14]|uniref:LysR family transcriptional regulator n=1 Tax=Streptomyces sp. 4F14 TaxID=3394380 RepID=UPI003A8A2E63
MALDLNLLVPLDALLKERSVTKAAQRLGLSQPTVSAALARLRRHFGDQLLTRVGNTYELTPLAARLVEQTAQALGSVDRVFLSRPVFEPTHSRREFTLSASDVHVATLGRVLADLLRERAPGVRLRFRTNTMETVAHAKDRLAALDAVVLPQGLLSDFPVMDLYEDRWVCVASAAALPTHGELSARPWVMPYHFPWAMGFSPAHRLQAQGIEPRVEIAVENFLSIPALLTGTDRVAVVSVRALSLFPAGHGLGVVELPLGPGPVVESLWWDAQHDRDPAHIWLRGVVAEAGALVAATPWPETV